MNTRCRTPRFKNGASGSPCKPNIVPEFARWLNVCDPCHKAKLRRAAARSASCLPSRFPTASRSSARSPSRGHVIPHVVYLAASQPGWDQPGSWFSEAAGYGSEILRSWQRARPGRTPITVAARHRAGAVGGAARLRGELGVRPRHAAGAGRGRAGTACRS